MDGDEGRDAGAACDEDTRSLVGDGAPDIAQDQAATGRVAVEALGDAIAAGVEVALDGELELRVVGKRGEGEGMHLVAPAVFVEGDLGRLPRLDTVAFRLFEAIAANVVGDVFDVEDFDAVIHASLQ